MPRYKTLKERYKQCETEGQFRIREQVNDQEIIDFTTNAEIYIKGAEIIAKTLKPKDHSWMSVYVNYYEALRIYVEAFLFKNKIKIPNHQCLFAYLCFKYPKLEFNWDFFEKVRTKRNGAHYYGGRITYEDWKEVEVQMKLYINALKDRINVPAGIRTRV